MHQINNRVIIWSTDVINLLEGKTIGGITVQMYFWAQTFCEHGWDVYSFMERQGDTIVKEGIHFLPKRNIKRVNLLSEWWYAFRFISKLKPNLIIYRGANRELLPLVQTSRLLGAKLLFFSASDVNFEPGNELVGSELNRKMYHRAIKHIPYFVVQNQHQHDTLMQNYEKKSLVRFNIWGEVSKKPTEDVPQCDAVWVANFRTLKRAEWVVDAAEKIPNHKFVLAGGPSGDIKYYEDIKCRSIALDNLVFLGGRSFFYTCELVARSKVLLCTSTFEGFPNTFLQAWSHGKPVISTVDPSGIISKYHLGEVVETEDELVDALVHILDDKEYYEQLKHNVNVFFKENHSSEAGYNSIIQYING